MSGSDSAGDPAVVFGRLRRTYPDARCELEHRNPFELLIATVLSAQSTDAGVNKVTPVLFARWPDAVALAGAAQAEVAEVIRPTGFFRTKAANIIALAQRLVVDHDARVPADRAALVRLPGVGRKTANVVLGHAFGVAARPCDTHVLRVAGRLGWLATTKPEVAERQLGALFAPADWTLLSDTLIFHGRRCCHARRAACGAGPVAACCPSNGIGEPDPQAAARLVKRP